MMAAGWYMWDQLADSVHVHCDGGTNCLVLQWSSFLYFYYFLDNNGSPFFMPSYSELDVLSPPLALHPDAQGTHWHQGKMHNVLMYLQCKAVGVSFRRIEDVTCDYKVPRLVEVGVWMAGHIHDFHPGGRSFCVPFKTKRYEPFPDLNRFMSKLNQTSPIFS